MVVPFIARFLHWFVVGVGTTVMSLLMLSKGCSVETLGLVAALYSAFIVVFEFPSGVLSDVVGQRKVYLFSITLSIVGYAIVLASDGILWLLVGFSFYGVARAFSSGSIEALFISRFIAKRGKAELHRLIAAMNAGEILGLAAGALSGGLIPMAWASLFPGANRFDGNLVVQIAVLAALACFILFAVEDGRGEGVARPRVGDHVWATLSAVVKDRAVLILALGTAVWGFCFNAVELYWQPRLREILGPDQSTWLFGVVNGGYFLASLAGVGVVNLVLSRTALPRAAFLVLARLTIGALIVALSFQAGIVSFASVYLVLMMVNGMTSVPEGTLLNERIPDDRRSSILSFASLTMQAGGIVGSLLFSVIVGQIAVVGVWMLVGIVFALSSSLYLFLGRDPRRAVPTE